MGEFLKEITPEKLAGMNVDALRRMHSCEVVSSEGDYICTIICPPHADTYTTMATRMDAESIGVRSNAVKQLPDVEELLEAIREEAEAELPVLSESFACPRCGKQYRADNYFYRSHIAKCKKRVRVSV